MKLFKKNKKGGILDPDEIFADSASVLDALSNPEGKIERPLGRLSHVVFFLLVLAGFGYLGVRASFLQMVSGEYFFSRSQENRFLTRSIFAPRGIIYDRFGTPLVENQPTFGLYFEKSAFFSAQGNLESLLVSLGAFLEKPPEYFFELGFPRDYNPQLLPSSIFIAQGISPEKIVPLAAKEGTLPGVRIFESFQRIYPDSYAMSHLVGYVGKVSREELLDHPEFAGEETVGKSGVEKAYDESLRGRGGRKIVEVDAHGKESRFRLVIQPQAGRNIALTLDGKLQRAAYEVVSGYTRGEKAASVVALDPRSAELLALLSVPGFNTNKFAYSLTREEFDAVLKNPLRPLFNRALSGEFPIGSILKPVVGAAALEEGLINPVKQIYDEGFISIPNPYNPGEESVFLDWKKHGWIDFYDAIAQSANVYFYTVGGGYKDQKGLGIRRIKEYASAFGLGSILGIDLPGERPGLVPDPEWKKIAEPHNPVWRIGDTYNVSIGQGGIKATPLQVTSMTAAIANGGKLYRPYAVSAVLEDGDPVVKNVPTLLRDNIVSRESLSHVVSGMRQAVTEGTAWRLSEIPVEVAAKTGTAEVGGGLKPHAWVTAFAPVEEPEIAITVMVEHAGEGATVAVPIMHDILQWYFRNLLRNTN